MITNNQGNTQSFGNVIGSNNGNKYNNNQTGVNLSFVKLVSGTVGFLLGVLSSVLASWIYDLIKAC